MLKLKTGSDTLTRDPTRPGQSRWPGDLWPGNPVPSLAWAAEYQLTKATGNSCTAVDGWAKRQGHRHCQQRGRSQAYFRSFRNFANSRNTDSFVGPRIFGCLFSFCCHIIVLTKLMYWQIKYDDDDDDDVWPRGRWQRRSLTSPWVYHETHSASLMNCRWGLIGLWLWQYCIIAYFPMGHFSHFVIGATYNHRLRQKIF